MGTRKDIAFKNGAPRVLAFDQVFFAEYLTGALVGDKEASKAMKQWLKGWDTANIGNPCTL